MVEAVIGDGVLKRDAYQSGEAADFDHCLTDKGDYLTLPAEGICHDAFFIARLTRPV